MMVSHRFFEWLSMEGRSHHLKGIAFLGLRLGRQIQVELSHPFFQYGSLSNRSCQWQSDFPAGLRVCQKHPIYKSKPRQFTFCVYVLADYKPKKLQTWGSLVQSAARVLIVPTFPLQPIILRVKMGTRKRIPHKGLTISEKSSFVIFLIQTWMCIFTQVRIKIRFQEDSINFDWEMKRLISVDVSLVICISGSQ